MTIIELEELVSTIRGFFYKARLSDDAYEYCRLSDELCLAQAALSNARHEGNGLYLIKPVKSSFAA